MVKTASTPLFGVSVPIVAHEMSDPEKGTGLAMVCTFGDTTDVIWWRELDLDLRALVQRDGRLRSVNGVRSRSNPTIRARRRSPMTSWPARPPSKPNARIVELLQESGDLEGDPRPITHAVKFWENGTRPLEIVTSNQWFIRYPDKAVLLKKGEELTWWPDIHAGSL